MHPQGLSGSEAARRLTDLGEPAPPNSRSMASIVAGNVFTLFNAVIGVFFVLILSLGLWADAIFGFIAALNSYIGIRQELSAKETLDALALLVAPKAQAIRDGVPVDLRADEVVPGDVVRVEPGDQLVADGEVIASRGLTMDESMLTGESDGIRKDTRDRVLSGSFCLNGSGYYEVDAVRENSHAEKVAGEAREFRHPPSPLQEEVNKVIWASTIVLVPLGAVVLFALNARNTPFTEAAQTATAGLVTLIPEGLVLLMSVTLAVAAVRLAKQNTLVQQMAATEALAAVDTICVDKTGTLTDGELELVEVVPADGAEVAGAERALARFAASAGERNRTLQVIADKYRSAPETPVAEVPFSSAWKWSGADAERRVWRRDCELRDGRSRHSHRQRVARTAAGAAGCPGRAHRCRPPRGRVCRGPRSAPVRPGQSAASTPAAEGTRGARGAAASRRRGDDRVHARAGRGPEADLGRCSLDRHGRRLRDRRAPGRRRRRGTATSG